jgi:fumarylacetoacetase
MEPSFPGTQTMTDLNETHDPALTSWVQSANDDTLGFPVQNLPYCVFRRRGTQDAYGPGPI